MASMRDIKRRKSSIQSTEQITKAMKLVSTVKLQRAKSRAENAKPYFTHMFNAVYSILAKSSNVDHKFLKGGQSEKKGIIVITSNRGLAGGYNNNIVKLITQGDIPKEDVVAYTIGKKGKDSLERYGYTVAADFSEVINEPIYRDAMDISDRVLSDFVEGNIGEIYLAYTGFKNTVSHIPTLLKLLPVDGSDITNEEDDDKLDDITLMNYEPEEDEVLDIIIPKYVTSLIYGALMEAVASENGARMQAMDNATNNADEMISDLELKYNRARQSSITQEITEIIAGAQAIT